MGAEPDEKSGIPPNRFFGNIIVNRCFLSLRLNEILPIIIKSPISLDKFIRMGYHCIIDARVMSVCLIRVFHFLKLI